jgi:hypothetical protein
VPGDCCCIHLRTQWSLYLYFLFSWILPLPSLPIEMPSFQSVTTPRGEFVLEQPSTFSSSCKLRPDFIAMVRNWPFSGAIRDDPHDHLKEFEELCSCLVILGMTQETLRWKLFPFSLVDRVEQWYTRTIRSVDNWENFVKTFVTRSPFLNTQSCYRVNSVNLAN